MSVDLELAEAVHLIGRLVRSIEEIHYLEDWDCFPDEVWDAYEKAREFIGKPITLYPGGEEGEHFHFSTFDPEHETCSLCEQHEDDTE